MGAMTCGANRNRIASDRARASVGAVRAGSAACRHPYILAVGPLRLVVQDAALSRRKHGFESRRGHQATFSRIPEKPQNPYKIYVFWRFGCLTVPALALSPVIPRRPWDEAWER